MKVLVVDDVGLIRHRLQQMLQSRGIAAVTAKDGPEAIHAVQSDNHIDVVVTDLFMAGMSGLDLFKAVRGIERFDDRGSISPPQFVLITAIRPSDDRGSVNGMMLQQAKDLGFAAVLHKPIDRETLFAELQAIKLPQLAAGRFPPPNPSPRGGSLFDQWEERGRAILDSSDRVVLERYRHSLRAQLTQVERSLDALGVSQDAQ